MSVIGHESKRSYAQKKVGTLPVAGSDEQKRTNEIGMAIPLLETCDIAGKDVTGDALLTQRALATYLVEERQAHYHFTVKSNQPTLESDIALLFETRGDPDFVEVAPPDHGRIETRSIWCSSALNAYLDFPHVGQVFLIERESIEKKTGVQSREIALGITSRTPQEASPKRILAVNRGHWSIESVHYIIDWNYDEDRSQIRTGFGPENITRLRRFAVGILKSFQKPAHSIAEMMRKLSFRTRLVFDYLRMTKNSSARGFAY
jgi:predicted transposase YbfD/YdcC